LSRLYTQVRVRATVARPRAGLTSFSALQLEPIESLHVRQLREDRIDRRLRAREHRRIALRIQARFRVSEPPYQVDELLPQKISLMPAGLLTNLTEQQVRDLFAYLRGSQPLNEQP